MSQFDLVIRARRAIVNREEVACSVGVSNGRIAEIAPFSAGLTGHRVIDLGPDEVLMPGIVDCHVHLCDPGNTEWEGFAHATRAAAAGGITALVDMPLDSSPVTCDLRALELKRQTAEGQCYVDMGFWAGVVPHNLGNLRPLHEAGVLGFKCYVCETGLDEFPGVTIAQLEEAMRELAPLDQVLMVHAESEDAIAKIPQIPDTRNYAEYLTYRPRGVENLAVAQVIEASRLTGCRAHILHLSTADVLPMLASARRDGVKVSTETCPHYLTIAAEQIPDGGTAFKVGPPIREADNREALWRGIESGLLDMVISDHSPCTVEMKNFDTGNFATAWGGLSSLQVSLPVMWTEARKRGYQLTHISKWMSEKTAGFAGLSHKGQIAVGLDADFCIFAPDESFVVDKHQLHHRHPITAYDGFTLTGVVRRTFLRGQCIDIQASPRGKLLSKSPRR
jgi:allantoinase